MLRLFSVLSVLLLAACGADAPPEPPVTKAAHGVSVSGCVQMGVVSGRPALGSPDC